MFRQHHQLNGHEFERTLNSRTEEPGVLQCTGSQRFRHKLVTEQQWATQQLASVQTFKLLITCIYTILSGIETVLEYKQEKNYSPISQLKMNFLMYCKVMVGNSILNLDFLPPGTTWDFPDRVVSSKDVRNTLGCLSLANGN